MTTAATPNTGPIAVERAKQVFRFLKAFSEKSVPARRQVAEHHWVQWLRQLPTHPSISIGEVQLVVNGDASTSTDAGPAEALITIRRPKTTSAPPPPDSILDFVQSGWSDPEGAIQIVETRNVMRGRETFTERFDDDAQRPRDLEEWRTAWKAWAEAERPARKAMQAFERFYALKGRIDRDSEGVELMLGDGRLRWNAGSQLVDHPVLLQRVELVFDPDVPELRVVDTDREPELYSPVLEFGESLLSQHLNTLRSELEKGGYHPLAREGTSGYLKRVVQLLSSSGRFIETEGDAAPSTGPTISREPVLFLRDRSSGFAAAFDRVLEDLEEREDVPVSITRLVGVEPPINDGPALGEWSPWGQPPDVLLSKPANAEQVHIARALEQHKAVLVQGPPGTGKSHTIANLIGHLVANGKRVLVTSHTTKALRVLRGHVVETVRPLCVALLENDLEGRNQMEEAVKGILARLTASSPNALEREVVQLASARAELNKELTRIAMELRTIREVEYAPIVVAGESALPSEAARWIIDNTDGNDWIPGRVQASAPLPLSDVELKELYASNGTLSEAEEKEMTAGLPPSGALPTAVAFANWVAAIEHDEPPGLAAFWDRPGTEGELPALTRMRESVMAMANAFKELQQWQLSLVAAGYAGGSDPLVWRELSRLVLAAENQVAKARAAFLDHEPKITAGVNPNDAVAICGDIAAHLERGGSLGAFSLLLHPKWKEFLHSATCNGREARTLGEIRALALFAKVQAGRASLMSRWIRQAEPSGLPHWSSLGSEPEVKLKEFVLLFDGLLVWWSDNWSKVEREMASAGFRWQPFRNWHVARSTGQSAFDQDSGLLTAALQDALESRYKVACRAVAQRMMAELEELLRPFTGPVCAVLSNAIKQRDVGGFASSIDALQSLIGKTTLFTRRNALLNKFVEAAPDWSEAVLRRHGVHGSATVPGDAARAWRFSQLRQEVDRRAGLDEVALTRLLRQRHNELRDTTASLIDRRAWLGQIRRIDLPARQALQGWAQMQKRIGKGTGKRAPVLQAAARKLLAQARDAVPVWIMPLSRVAESFDARKPRFDVVIVDEASQSDVTGLLAWYIGDRVAVVGDHEQVSPLAVGQQIETMSQLIAAHLTDVPNKELYDGKLSIYDIARQSFGGTIALREHFRCVPDIIDFSNYLSYNGDIRPLRDPTRVPRPHVIEYVADGVTERVGKQNEKEARLIVAIMKALCERPENEKRTMGAISLLGDEQAGLIQDLAVQSLGAVELDRRRFAAGNPAQFQGDERDIVFLSLVDAPPATGLHRLRQDELFKQRYNVAVSRARDQLWLIHSLDPNKHLQANDLRRRLIEHVRAPNAKRSAIESAKARAESEFEKAVLQRLISSGYRVTPQVWVGQYRMDMVVSDDTGQVALECDGDRFHPPDQIPADMARQAVLERAGWRFVRVRGTRFYRDQDATMNWIFAELAKLGVLPAPASPVATAGENSFRDDIVRRAWEIMRENGWTAPIGDDPPGNHLEPA